MSRYDFEAFGPITMRQNGNEPVHFAVEFQLFGNVCTNGLQRAAKIVDRESRDFGNESVGDFGGEFSVEPRVLAILTPAVDKVVAFVDVIQHHGNIRRIILQVTIKCHDHFTLCVVDACLHGRGLAKVSSQQDEFKACIRSRQQFDFLSRPVR